MTDNTDPFALIDAEVRGFPCRIFADTPPHLASLWSLLDVYGDREFLLDGDTRWTFKQVRNAASLLAQDLAARGYAPGDRIALVLPNGAGWVVSFVAITAIGAVPALVNARGAAEEIQHCVHSTGCVAWIGDARTAAVDVAADRLDWAEIEPSARNAPDAALPVVDREHNDEALLMFTSGTTGRAKAAILTHLGVLTSLKTIQYSGLLVAQDMAAQYGIAVEQLMQMRPPTVTLLMFPMFHVSGCHAVFLNNLSQGARIVMLKRWDPETALEVIEREGVTAFPAVPTMYWDLLKAAETSGRNISSLTSLSVGGQGTPPALLNAVTGAFPSAVIGTGYGMTENNGTVSMAVGSAFVQKPHATGRPVATVQVEIRDEAGRPLPANTTGEIHVRGATLMAGYANAEPPFFDDNGWFASGDIGYLDDDGCVCIVDRRTDMVISGGENIYCAEVERAIDLHPQIRESAALGEPDERLGERVVAVACLEADGEATEEAVLASLDAHLARYKIPKRIVLTREPLPRNPTGKIIKRQVREIYLKEPA